MIVLLSTGMVFLPQLLRGGALLLEKRNVQGHPWPEGYNTAGLRPLGDIACKQIAFEQS